MLHTLFTHKNTHTMTFYYYLKPKHENKKHAMFVCVCLCVLSEKCKSSCYGGFFSTVYILYSWTTFFFGIAWLLIINVQIAHGFQFSIQNTQVHVYCCNTFHLIL